MSSIVTCYEKYNLLNRSKCTNDVFNDVIGQILWRRVLEKGYDGHIRILGGVADGDLISVSGGVPAIVRAWDLTTGHILNEWPIAEPNTDRFVR